MTEPGLFDHANVSDAGNFPHQTKDSVDGFSHKTIIRRSALWAAYGDALGWISELTDSAGLSKRTAGIQLRRPIEWTRRIGGRSGVMVPLPRGCYSDDSQLRLATGRAIRSEGFDVEAFAKVELPIWLSYALGGGRSTSVAAANLAKPKVPWFANTYTGWIKSGGNGAAMRIQPHVWAARTPGDPESFIPDVIRNTVCTHSHPSGLMGALLHALALAHTMVNRRYPSPEDLLSITDVAASLPEIVRNDIELGNYWRAAYERESATFREAWPQAIDECRKAVRIAGGSISSASGVDRYTEIVDRLGLRDPARRGSGMLTAVAAVGLIWCEKEPEQALSIAANEIGTDTDTIATMAGAILGAIADTEPPVEVLDADLFRSEADRLANIAQGEEQRHHRYPDLLYWSAPKTRADSLIRSRDGGLYVRGLGGAEALREPMASANHHFMWQWLRLKSGQTLLIKRRKDLLCDVQGFETSSTGQTLDRTSTSNDDPSEWGPGARRTDDRHPQAMVASKLRREPPSEQMKSLDLQRGLDLQRVLDYIAAHKDDDRIIGATLRRVVSKGTPGQIAAFTSALIDSIRQAEKALRPHGR